jgi:ureidoglycolate hydrolase
MAKRAYLLLAARAADMPLSIAERAFLAESQQTLTSRRDFRD